MKNLLRLFLLFCLGILFVSTLFCITNHYLPHYMIPGIWYGYFPVIGIVTGIIHGRFSSAKGSSIFFTAIAICAMIGTSRKLLLPCDSTFHAIPPLIIALIFTLTAESAVRANNRGKRKKEKTESKMPPAL